MSKERKPVIPKGKAGSPPLSAYAQRASLALSAFRKPLDFVDNNEVCAYVAYNEGLQDKRYMAIYDDWRTLPGRDKELAQAFDICIAHSAITMQEFIATGRRHLSVLVHQNSLETLEAHRDEITKKILDKALNGDNDNLLIKLAQKYGIFNSPPGTQVNVNTQVNAQVSQMHGSASSSLPDFMEQVRVQMEAAAIALPPSSDETSTINLIPTEEGVYE